MYLIIGTGKTLVAVMVLSHMLRENPHHSAVFLVDKNLLGRQQFKFIQDQIGKKKFERFEIILLLHISYFKSNNATELLLGHHGITYYYINTNLI